MAALNDNKKSWVDKYLDLVKECEAQYGPQTIVLMQIGAFFEMYGRKDGDRYVGSQIEEACKVCDLQMSAKDEGMAGFQLPQLDRYVRKLQEANFTIVIYRQYTLPDGTYSRQHSETISPGTYFGAEPDALTNYTACIWMQYVPANRYQKVAQVFMGVAAIDVYTGHTRMAQFTTTITQSTVLQYDGFDRFMTSIKPSEVTCIYNWESSKVQEVLQMVGLTMQTKLHMVDLQGTGAPMLDKAHNAEKQTYQRNVLNKYYPSSPTFVDQLLYTENGFVAIQALCFLLDFVYNHCPGLVDRLDHPTLETDDNRLILANHSLAQLNMIDGHRPLGQHQGKLGSVGAMLNQCVTPMGKRSFLMSLQQPITVTEQLERCYAVTAGLLTSGDWEKYRQGLQTVKDMERFARKLIMKRLVPKDIASFFQDIDKLEKVWRLMENDQELRASTAGGHDIGAKLLTVATCLNNTFDMALCAQAGDIDDYGATTAEQDEHEHNPNPNSSCFIKPGVSAELDDAMRKYQDQDRHLLAIRDYLCELLVAAGEVKTKQVATAVKIRETAKSYPTLVMTSRRATILKKLLEGKSEVSLANNSLQFDVSKLTFTHHGSKTVKDVEISSPVIERLTRTKQTYKEMLQTTLRQVFADFLADFTQEHLAAVQHILSWVRELDVQQCRAYLAHRYNLCRPVLEPAAAGNSSSYVRFEGIRHPLIEQLQTRELYVTNDLHLCEEGLLLYGTNAVGKTSFIKSVGIAIVMAQAGLYVACRQFTYWPYRYLFTRILGNDNLFKGQSTFAVEMSELRTILLHANANSLVLGDELCSGTESDSALSIFTAGLEMLHARRATFLFATHFHEVVAYDEIKALDRLHMMHMTVRYDQANQTLVYDRKLQPGSGDSMYGLEVCKALDLPADFLQRAHDIRQKYNPRKRSLLAEQPSRYNRKKLMGMCEICEDGRATETHHLQHQQHAKADNAYLRDGDAHKNHAANLLRICDKCHDALHKTGRQHKVSKTLDGRYVIVALE